MILSLLSFGFELPVFTMWKFLKVVFCFLGGILEQQFIIFKTLFMRTSLKHIRRHSRMLESIPFFEEILGTPCCYMVQVLEWPLH